MPHVSPRAAIAWMNLLLGDPKTTELERAHLKDAVQQLNKFLPQPHSGSARRRASDPQAASIHERLLIRVAGQPPARGLAFVRKQGTHTAALAAAG